MAFAVEFHAHAFLVSAALLLSLAAVEVQLEAPGWRQGYGSRYAGQQVIRVIPANSRQAEMLRTLARDAKLDLWHPSSGDLIHPGAPTDFRVPRSVVAGSGRRGGEGGARGRGASLSPEEVKAFLSRANVSHTVLMDDVQKVIDAQLKTSTRDKRNARGYNYNVYHPLEEIVTWMSDVAEQNPALVSRILIGKSYEGRPLYILQVGKKKGGTKPSMWLDCGMHAREWISPAFCQWFVKEAVRTQRSDPAMRRLLNRLDFYVMPVLNVDGYAYSWNKDRLWRKTRSKTSRKGCLGADANRNWNVGWSGAGASVHPCDETYCGGRPESEPEVKAAARFLKRQRRLLRAYVTVHAYAQLLLYPYAHRRSAIPNRHCVELVANEAVSALHAVNGSKYDYGPASSTMYVTSGSSLDWAYSQGARYSFALELRDTGRYGFLLPERQIGPTCAEAMRAVSMIAAAALRNCR
ncbi:carboxypeptidase A6-like [Lethenteron reissneri]|uniref:carboxypeptidase A6-like n=1 Tax=Lethenteron reissneri TaxID=7753 RepID=UPI002AB7961D|nr:carboxypeptidase A6-like [Lethenteron reissneri]